LETSPPLYSVYAKQDPEGGWLQGK